MATPQINIINNTTDNANIAIYKGGVLSAEELSLSEVAIQSGQTAYVTGDTNSGYSTTIKNGLYSTDPVS